MMNTGVRSEWRVAAGTARRQPRHALAGLATGIALAICSGFGTPLSGQIARGQVVDSVTAVPIAGATVVLLSADLEVARTTSDDGGLFLVRAERSGQYRLRVQHAGFRTSTFPAFELAADDVTAFMLLVPAVEAERTPEVDLVGVIGQVCPSLQPGRPAIAGWVVDGASGRPVPGAGVVFSWASVPDILSERASLSDFTGAAVTDSVGFYAICGVPPGRRILMHSRADSGMSRFTALVFEGPGVSVDERSHVMHEPVWQQDFTILHADQRATGLRGIIADELSGDLVAGAEVELLGTGFVSQSDQDGAFGFTGLPAGPATVVVRRVGSDPLRRNITLPVDGMLDLPRGMLMVRPAATSLDPITVETTAPLSPLAEFNERRERGAGSFITRDEFTRMGNPLKTSDVLRRMAGVRLEPSPDPSRDWIVSMRRGGPRTFGFANTNEMEVSGFGCPPLVFLDHQYLGDAVTVDVDRVIAVSEIEAVEAHPSVATMPTEFNRRGAQCGVLAFWTRNAQPRSVPVQNSKGLLGSPLFHAVFAVGAVVGIFFALGEGIHF